MNYDPKTIEEKWQRKWAEEGLYKAEDFSGKEKKYILIEFPYPSGAGLHVGHVRSYTALDAFSRKLRMQGKNVLYPIGWDAFGLPTENYAIKNKIHPHIATEQNICAFKKQIKSLGISFDWSREIDTTDSSYYKWTQWIFLKLLENGLAYKANIPINWCPACKIGLANEEVVDGKCERCGAETEKRQKEQWMLAITKYADRLIDDLETVDYLEKIKTQQINWIGRSNGASLKFKVKSSKCEGELEVFTTRSDTLFGCTYMVVCPEHEIISKFKTKISNLKEVEKYINKAKNKGELERAENKEKTGVEIKGIKAVNPVNNEEIPIFVADYVFSGYGTGAIMAVPAHDERDFEFAKKYGLSIKKVVLPEALQSHYHNPKSVAMGANNFIRIEADCFLGEGIAVNSEFLNGLKTKEAKEKIIEWLEKNGAGKRQKQYHLRDWVFSRQHYWGEPIPLVYCEHCKEIIVRNEKEWKLKIENWKLIENCKLKIENLEFSKGELLNPGWIVDNNLPIKLPEVKSYEPSDTGESPLANIIDWINTTCPKCGGTAKRETDTMPNWAGSSWYFLRYIDPKNDKAFSDLEKLKYWMPVDLYNGGMEHTTLHLLYSRFWNKFLYDIGVVPTSEPYARRVSHGMIQAEDGKKMSKSLGNVINPDDVVKKFGADALRVFEMFVGPYAEAIPWNTDGLKGVRRFLERVWEMGDRIMNHELGIMNNKITRLTHKTIKKVSEDIDNFKFNTAISAMMIVVNEMEKVQEIEVENYKLLLLILSPFAPHICEELWERIAHTEGDIPECRLQGSIFTQSWPIYDPELARDETAELVIQINGKMRDKVEVLSDISEDEAKNLALAREKVQEWTKGKNIMNMVFVKGRLVNIVVR